LASLRAYLDASDLGAYEVIVVDDGSVDGTSVVVRACMPHWPQLTVLRRDVNLGKGATVRDGVLATAGRLIAFTDADGATPIEEEAKLRSEIDRGADIAVGSRMLGTGSADRTPLRRGLGSVFAWIARRALDIPVRDTQCGFKMFRREVALRLFVPCNEDGYTFDLFTLALGHRLGYRITEVEVRWREIPGSKIRFFRDVLRMTAGLVRIRRVLGSRISLGWSGTEPSGRAPLHVDIARPGSPRLTCVIPGGSRTTLSLSLGRKCRSLMNHL